MTAKRVFHSYGGADDKGLTGISFLISKTALWYTGLTCSRLVCRLLALTPVNKVPAPVVAYRPFLRRVRIAFVVVVRKQVVTTLTLDLLSGQTPIPGRSEE